MYNKIKNFLKKHFEEATCLTNKNIFIAFFIGSFAHSTHYFIHKIFFGLKESVAVRIIATFLCLAIGFYPILSSKIQKNYFPFYWHLIAIFALPFSITYLTLLNNFANLWLLWMIFMPITLSIFIPNWLIYLIDLFIGMSSAFLINFFLGGNLIFNGFDPYAFWLIFVFSSISAIGFVYGNRSSWLEKQELQFQESMAIAGSIAHELRNPIGSIKAALQSLTAQSEENKIFKEQVNQTLNLATNIIDMTLQQLSGKNLRPEDFTFLSAQASVLESLKIYGYKSQLEKQKVVVKFGENNILNVEEIEERNLLKTIDKDSDFAFRGVDTAFKYLIFNLIKNSLYYLNQFPQSCVTIGIEKNKTFKVAEDLTQEFNVIYVYDTGPGIPTEILGKLFGDFVTSGKKGGTGLGLAFCKRVMKNFGGDIICESKYLPQDQNNQNGTHQSWTKFSMLFPKLSTKELNLLEQQPSQLNEKEGSGAQQFNKNLIKGPSRRILLVDDQLSTLIITKANIEKALPYVICETASSGFEAIKMVKNNIDAENSYNKNSDIIADNLNQNRQYSLILMDIDMPEMDGIETSKKIRELLPNIPIIADTSRENRLDIQSATSDYIHKPPYSHLLYRTINKWLLNVKDDFTYLGSEEQYLQHLKGKNILLVDDQQMNRLMIKKMLERYGLKITEASDGKELLELYQKNQEEHKQDNNKPLFDLIITDINMPPYNGDDAARQIRAIEQQNKPDNYKYNQNHYRNRNSHIPIIALSGDGREEDVKHFFFCQIDDYFMKGNDPEILVKIIAVYLKAVDRDNQRKNQLSDGLQGNLQSQLQNNNNSQSQEIGGLNSSLPLNKELKLKPNLGSNSSHKSNQDSNLKIFNKERIAIFDPEEQKLIISTFLSSSSVSLDKVRQNKIDNNLKDLLANLHSIKGSSGTIGAEVLYDYIVRIEKELKGIENINNHISENNGQNPSLIRDVLFNQNWLEELIRVYQEMKGEMELL